MSWAVGGWGWGLMPIHQLGEEGWHGNMICYRKKDTFHYGFIGDWGLSDVCVCRCVCERKRNREAWEERQRNGWPTSWQMDFLEKTNRDLQIFCAQIHNVKKCVCEYTQVWCHWEPECLSFFMWTDDSCYDSWSFLHTHTHKRFSIYTSSQTHLR